MTFGDGARPPLSQAEAERVLGMKALEMADAAAALTSDAVQKASR
jgi:hypothetical protein